MSASEEVNDTSSSSSSLDRSATTSRTADRLNSLQEYDNKSNVRDQVFSAISEDGSVKVTACTARNLINDLMLMHTMTAVPADALGRTVICALLISNGMQAEQTMQITINSDGPIRGIVAISSGLGKVRGYVGSPMLGDMFQLPEAVGKGLVQVVKNHPDWPNPYNGITAIRHGDIDRDVGAYLAESEQRSCALAASTTMSGILCTAAGGYLVERLPNADPETLARVERNLATLVEKDGGDKLPTNLLLNGVTPLDIVEIVLDGLGMQPLQQLEPSFQCHCSSQRLVRALRLLPRTEVDDILKTQGKIEARCEFCGKTYEMGPNEILTVLETPDSDQSVDSEFQES
jgi:molecular chaperone Hsp33